MGDNRDPGVAAVMSSYKFGFVYVLSNQAMPGIVKIGHTMRLADDRAQQLFTTGVPVAFDVELRLATSAPRTVELEAHRILAQYRLAGNREFFRIAPTAAMEAVQQAALTQNGIEAWSRRPLHRIRAGDRLALKLRSQQVFVAIAYETIFSRSASLLDIWQAHADGDCVEMFATDDAPSVAGMSDKDVCATHDPVPHLDRAGHADNLEMIGRERLVPGDRLVWLDANGGGDECISTIFEADAYCQIVARTGNPSCSPDGWPLLLNHLTHDPPTSMSAPIREALALPPPRSWAPRRALNHEGWPEIGTRRRPAEYWLHQLAPICRGRTRT